MKNKILEDFGEEGLYIDISTKTYPGKAILIDRDVFGDIADRGFKIYIQGGKTPVFMIGRKVIYLQRHVMGLKPNAGDVIIHKDRLHVDYRKSNLKVVPRIPNDIKKHKPLRSYYLAHLRKSGFAKDFYSETRM